MIKFSTMSYDSMTQLTKNLNELIANPSVEDVSVEYVRDHIGCVLALLKIEYKEFNGGM